MTQKLKTLDFEKKSELYKALSDPTRLKILHWLLDVKCCKCICHLAQYVSKDQSTVFRHIEVLRRAGIIKTRKEDKFLYCEIADNKLLARLMRE